MKTLALLVSFLCVSVSAFAALPVNHISDQVVVIGTPAPVSPTERNFSVDKLVQFEADFAAQAGTTIAAVITEKAKKGFIFTGSVSTSFTTPTVPGTRAEYVRSGMITSAVLIFTKIGAPPESQ